MEKVDTVVGRIQILVQVSLKRLQGSPTVAASLIRNVIVGAYQEYSILNSIPKSI